eukprot:g71978.t1
MWIAVFLPFWTEFYQPEMLMEVRAVPRKTFGTYMTSHHWRGYWLSIWPTRGTSSFAGQLRRHIAASHHLSHFDVMIPILQPWVTVLSTQILAVKKLVPTFRHYLMFSVNQTLFPFFSGEQTATSTFKR